MNRYQQFRVTASSQSIESILQDLLSRRAEGWARSAIRERSIDAQPDLYCFECDGRGERPPATIWVSTKNDGCVLYDTTIVPVDRNELTVQECNAVLRSFVSEMIRPVIDGLGVHLEVMGEELDLRDHMSTQVAQLLKAFSGAANKSTGSSHPSDKSRWLAFIIAVHRENSDWSPHDLCEWLQGDGWPDDEAWKLSLEYEFGRALLVAHETT